MTRLPWAGAPYSPRDRALAALLDRIAPAISVQVVRAEQRGPVLQRGVEINLLGQRLVGLETISPVSCAMSVQPRGREAAVYLLACMRGFGRPTTIYADDAGAARDLTAEWRAFTHMPSELARSALRDAQGLKAAPLDVEDLERLARA